MAETASISTGSIRDGRRTKASVKPSETNQRSHKMKIDRDEFIAASVGDVSWLKQALKDRKHPKSFDKNGLAAIHLSSLHGRLDCLKFLVEICEADVNLSSSTGWKPIHMAINANSGKRAFQCVQYLLEKGADPSAKNEDEITPAHQASIEGLMNCLQVIIDAGGIINGRDVKGHQPIDYAKLWGHKQCARILVCEMWKKEKEFQIGEIEKLHKLKTVRDQEERIAKEQERQDQDLYNQLAFNTWMENKKIGNQTNQNGSPAQQVSTSIGKGPDRLLYKANSVARGTGGQVVPRVLLTDGPSKGKWLPTPSKSVVDPKVGKVGKNDTSSSQDKQASPGHPESATEVLPQLPEELVERVLTGAKNPHQRDLVWKCTNIIDVQGKRFPPEELKPSRSQTYMHMSDCVDSHLFEKCQQMAKCISMDDSQKTSTVSSATSVDRFDQKRAARLLKELSRPNRYPPIQGQEYTFTFQLKN